MSSTAIPVPPRETYAVLVNGAMNPRIHHPQWYRMIGAIDEAELQGALAGNISMTPVLSQFEVGAPPIAIQCQSDFWKIQATDARYWQRILDISALVFTKLNETPVFAFTLSAQRHLDTRSNQVKDLIAHALVTLGFGMPTGKSVASNMTVSSTEDDYFVTMSIQPSVLSEKALFVSYQSFYKTGGKPDYFELGSLLKERFEKFEGRWQHASREAVASLNALAEQ